MPMKTFATKESQYIVQTLIDHGYEAYYVGGAVRDYLRGVASADIDITTSARPADVKKLFPKTVDVGIEFGTVLVMINGSPYEVTTFRHGEESVIPSLKEDLRRRDFTMNALAYTIDGQVIDFFGGEKDLQHQEIRGVDQPIERIIEDPLRILRAYRFVATFGYTIEQATLSVITEEASRLQEVSPERLKQELDRLFMGASVGEALTLMETSKVHEGLPVFPTAFPQRSLMLPFTSSREGWAYVSTVGAFSASEVAKAYVLSNEEKTFIQAVEQVLQQLTMEELSIDVLYQYDANVLYTADKLQAALQGQRTGNTLNDWIHKRQRLPIQSKKDLAVSGKDLLEWASERQGRWVGEWMRRIEQAVLHEQYANDKQVIKEWFIREYKLKR